MEEERVREIVRKVVLESLGEALQGRDAEEAAPGSDRRQHGSRPERRIRLAPGAERTSEIEEMAAERGAEIVEEGRDKSARGSRVAVGSDHAGFLLKNSLTPFLADLGYEVQDFGTSSSDPVDYPDIAADVARSVASGAAWRGIVVDGAGIGSSIAANKIPGIRAALCYDLSTARNAREHNDANLLALGGRLIGEDLARQIVEEFLATDFAGGRHLRRTEKIAALERGHESMESRAAELHPSQAGG